MRKFSLIAIAAFTIALMPARAFPADTALHGILHTKDNINIAYDHYKAGSDSVIIICPGFFNSSRNRWMRKAAEIVYPEYDVIIFDFRGHGGSSGSYTWSAKEPMDVDAVIDYAKSQKYRHIGILAFSLGAASAVSAVAGRDDVDSMALVSCPYRFNMIDYHFWEPGMLSDLKDNFACGWEGKGARVSNLFMPKKDPIDTITRIKRTPILFIHGDKDWIVKPRHSRKLYAAAPGYKEIEIIEGGLHAERLIEFHEETMRKLITGWFSRTFKK